MIATSKCNDCQQAFEYANKGRVRTVCDLCHADKRKKRNREHAKEYRIRPGQSEKRRQYQKVYQKRKRREPQYRLNVNMSRSIRRALNGNKNKHRWEKLVGYTVLDLKNHLEKQFQEGMSWDNYGKWHIDHKIPVTAFNYSRFEHRDFERCWELKNLQPMWSNENQSKKNKLSMPFQPSLLI